MGRLIVENRLRNGSFAGDFFLLCTPVSKSTKARKSGKLYQKAEATAREYKMEWW